MKKNTWLIIVGIALVLIYMNGGFTNFLGATVAPGDTCDGKYRVCPTGYNCEPNAYGSANECVKSGTTPTTPVTPVGGQLGDICSADKPCDALYKCGYTSDCYSKKCAKTLLYEESCAENGIGSVGTANDIVVGKPYLSKYIVAPGERVIVTVPVTVSNEARFRIEAGLVFSSKTDTMSIYPSTGAYVVNYLDTKYNCKGDTTAYGNIALTLPKGSHEIKFSLIPEIPNSNSITGELNTNVRELGYYKVKAGAAELSCNGNYISSAVYADNKLLVKGTDCDAYPYYYVCKDNAISQIDCTGKSSQVSTCEKSCVNPSKKSNVKLSNEELDILLCEQETPPDEIEYSYYCKDEEIGIKLNGEYLESITCESSKTCNGDNIGCKEGYGGIDWCSGKKTYATKQSETSIKSLFCKESSTLNCGNNKLDDSEECERDTGLLKQTTDFRGKTCESLGKGTGELECTTSCKIDYSGCEEGGQDIGESCNFAECKEGLLCSPVEMVVLSEITNKKCIEKCSISELSYCDPPSDEEDDASGPSNACKTGWCQDIDEDIFGDTITDNSGKCAKPGIMLGGKVNKAYTDNAHPDCVTEDGGDDDTDTCLYEDESGECVFPLSYAIIGFLGLMVFMVVINMTKK